MLKVPPHRSTQSRPGGPSRTVDQRTQATFREVQSMASSNLILPPWAGIGNSKHRHCPGQARQLERLFAGRSSGRPAERS